MAKTSEEFFFCSERGGNTEDELSESRAERRKTDLKQTLKSSRRLTLKKDVKERLDPSGSFS